MDQKTIAARLRTRGYSLTELIVATGLVAILLQIAIPRFTALLASWQRDLVTRTITGHLALARSEAIHWSHRVVMCSSTDGSACAPPSVKSWASGWLVFQDLDADNQYGPNDKMVAVSQGTAGIQRIDGNANVQRFVFTPTGMMASGMATLEIVPRMGAVQRITVNRIGRIRLSMAEPESDH